MSNPNRPNLVGRRYGNLVVIKEFGRNKYNSVIWLCQCDCGKETKVTTNQLNAGNTKRCRQCGLDKTHKDCIKHGLTGTPEYTAIQNFRRKERKMALDVLWTPEMEQALRQMFPYCVVCGSDSKLATDHVLPLSKGHGLEPGNAVRLCKHCNSDKHAKLPHELNPIMKNRITRSAQQFEEYWYNIREHT